MIKSRFSLFLGTLLGAALTAVVVTLLRSHHAPAAVAAFSVSGDEVKLAPAVSPLQFDVAPAALGAPLPRPPSTARVTTLEARTAPSYAPLDGRVVQVAVHIGDHVKEGARLLLVRSGDLAGMKRDLRAAQLSISTKQAQVARLQQLVEARAAPENDLMVAQSELNEARLTQSAADAKLRSLAVVDQGDIGYWVLATRSGTVVQLDAAPGKQVGPDKDKPVATVADLDEVLVIADVPQRDAIDLRAGQAVEIRNSGSSDSSPPIAGTIELVSDVVDPERQTVPVRIRVANKNRALRANAFVEACFISSTEAQVLRVPDEAVVSDGSHSVVFVETAPGAFKRRTVRVGHHSRDEVELLDGVKPGERIVVRGALLLINALAMSRK